MEIKELTYDNLIKGDSGNNDTGGIIYLKDVKLSQMRHYDIPLRLDFVAIVFCEKGQYTLFVNAHRHIVKADDLFINIPENIIKIDYESSDEETCCDILLIAIDFLRQTNFIGADMPAYRYLKETPILSLDEEEKGVMGIMDNIYGLISDSETNADIMRKLLTGIFLLKLRNIIQARINAAPAHAYQPNSRQEELFSKFLELLQTHHKEQRSITFYANELCVTPKYFSAVIKKISGQSPMDWINDYVIREAKAMLRFSNTSIQEIAWAMNFSSQTFFGKYFKRLTGTTPGEFRNEHP